MPNLPLFPLEAVLLPGGQLPLRIFEPRYLRMVRQCHQAGSPFGVVSLSQGSEVQVPGKQQFSLYPCGTLAHITELETIQPGLQVLKCTGGQRFTYSVPQQQSDGLWLTEAALVPDDTPTPVPSDLQHCATKLQRLIQLLRSQTTDNHPLPFQEPFQLNDCGWLANRWCELLGISLAEKHNLMALSSPLVRLELVADILSKTHFPE